MPEKASEVFKVETPHLTIRLYDDLLKLDLKGSFKSEIEEALENRPVLKETVGRMLGIFVPLHIRLIDVDSVHLDENGKIKISLSRHRDIVIPLERKEDAKILAERLNELTSKALDLKIKEDIEEKRAKRKRKKKTGGVSPSSYGTVPYYFPTEQVDIVGKFKRKRKKQKE